MRFGPNGQMGIYLTENYMLISGKVGCSWEDHELSAARLPVSWELRACSC